MNAGGMLGVNVPGEEGVPERKIDLGRVLGIVLLPSGPELGPGSRSYTHGKAQHTYTHGDHENVATAQQRLLPAPVRQPSQAPPLVARISETPVALSVLAVCKRRSIRSSTCFVCALMSPDGSGVTPHRQTVSPRTTARLMIGNPLVPSVVP